MVHIPRICAIRRLMDSENRSIVTPIEAESGLSALIHINVPRWRAELQEGRAEMVSVVELIRVTISGDGAPYI